MTAPPKSLAVYTPRKTSKGFSVYVHSKPIELESSQGKVELYGVPVVESEIEKLDEVKYLDRTMFTAICGEDIPAVKMLLEHVLGECKISFFHLRRECKIRIMVRCDACRNHILNMGQDRPAYVATNPIKILKVGAHAPESSNEDSSAPEGNSGPERESTWPEESDPWDIRVRLPWGVDGAARKEKEREKCRKEMEKSTRYFFSEISAVDSPPQITIPHTSNLSRCLLYLVSTGMLPVTMLALIQDAARRDGLSHHYFPSPYSFRKLKEAISARYSLGCIRYAPIWEYLLSLKEHWTSCDLWNQDDVTGELYHGLRHQVTKWCEKNRLFLNNYSPSTRNVVG
ncbi:hypothetical protein ADUPG1_012922 [Aduncisulcus paluster]|uniref:Uncharacterized protein n=1 Tax=Aduncisulcus paluster TaxID=2918883 RepID=A0ABQ5K5Y4_9EUKA|nr:hypothetical protein ADUPG1_012922 [Aduncisulcus paluster]